MKNNNEFDAVQMMRDIREKLSERYWNNPEVLKKEMQEVINPGFYEVINRTLQ